jgi:hypothetical protein
MNQHGSERRVTMNTTGTISNETALRDVLDHYQVSKLD